MKDYHHSQGQKYKDETKRYGFLSIDVLSCLNGKPWDEVALAYVSALKPHYIRVIRYDDGQTADAMQGRVTVYLDKDGLIDRIDKEVRVWLPDRVAHGDALQMALSYGIDSPQCQWHNDDRITGYFMDGINGEYYKILSNGESVPFPSPPDEDSRE